MCQPATAIEDREHLLDEVLAAYMQAAHQGNAPSRQELIDQYPTLAEDLSRFFADQDHINHLAAPLRRLIPPRQTLAPGCMLGDYELLEEIAQGGMGVVFKACQRTLNRTVAVKVLRTSSSAASAWRRFRVEVEAVAGLDHPHIVPVYEVGECDGQHFFSMKLIEGGSLAAAKDRFRGDARAAARLLATVARAVQHAHERGILHRDLKPSNVLLDVRGQPFVSDFGLAKRLSATGAPEEMGTTSGSPDADVTGAGGVVGTPGYMAPEQADGLPPTTAADVWGLGAILFELLTGRPPFQGANALEVLRRVREQEPPAPHSLESRVDRDLEAVCLACLRKDPKARYASARDLADDLDRYLASQPVSVRSVGRLRRFGRWCRRQPVIAALTGALVVVFLTAFIAVLREWRRAEHNFAAKEQEREQAEQQWQRAEANLDAVESLLEDFGSRLTEKQLAAIPGLQPAREQFLKAALRHYQEVLAQRAGDPRLRTGVAATYFRIAQITAAIGSQEEALAACEKALALYEELRAENPQDGDLCLAAARAVHRAGLLQTDLGRRQEALESFKRAQALLGQLRDDPVRGTEARNELGALLVHTGNHYMGAGRLEDAQACYEEDVRLREALLRDDPRSRPARYGLATALDNLGNVLGQRGDRSGCHRNFERARTLLQELNREELNDTVRQKLAFVLVRIGSLQCVERQFEQAVQTLKPALDLLESLVHDNPRVLPFQDTLATAYRQIGHAYRDGGRPNEAAGHYRKAVALSDNLHRTDPASASFRRGLAKGCFDLATACSLLKREQEAIRALKQARDHYRALAGAKPSVVDDHRSLTMTLNNLTLLLRDSRPVEALATAREASEQGREALRRAPTIVQHRELLGTSYKFLADLELRVGKPERAVLAACARHDLAPDDPTNLYTCARDLARAAESLGGAKRDLSAADKASRDDWRDRALHFLLEAVAKGMRNLGQLEQDEAWNALRQREEFRKLIENSKKTSDRGSSDNGDRRRFAIP
jgi:serine/threonine-protein kinase